MVLTRIMAFNVRPSSSGRRNKETAMRTTFSVLALALAFVPVSALADLNALEKDLGGGAGTAVITTAPDPAPAIVAPAPAPAPPPAIAAPVTTSADLKCVRVTLTFQGIDGKPWPGEGKGWITIQTDPSKVPGNGLLEALRMCNGGEKFATAQNGSSNSVDVLGVFNAQGEVGIKVPAKWKPALRARFHTADVRFGEKGFWQSVTFSDETEINMSVVPKGDGRVVEERKF